MQLLLLLLLLLLLRRLVATAVHTLLTPEGKEITKVRWGRSKRRSIWLHRRSCGSCAGRPDGASAQPRHICRCHGPS